MPLRSLRSRIPLKRKTWVPPAYPKVPSGVPSFAATPFYTYKLRNKILAGGKTIQFGNNVSEFKNRSRRIWRPNIKVKSLWSETLGRRVKLRMVTSVLRTMEKVGGLDSYLTCHTRNRMKELGPRGWEIRAAVIKGIRQRERSKHIRTFQRSVLLCPKLRMDMQWKEIRPFVKHTEGYAVLPEEYCKKAFNQLMARLREGRPKMQQRRYKPRTIVLTNGMASKVARQARLRSLPKHAKKVRMAARSQAIPAAAPRSTPRPVKNVPVPRARTPEEEAAARKAENWAKHKARQQKESYEKIKRVTRAREAGIRNAVLRKARLS